MHRSISLEICFDDEAIIFLDLEKCMQRLNLAVDVGSVAFTLLQDAI